MDLETFLIGLIVGIACGIFIGKTWVSGKDFSDMWAILQKLTKSSEDEWIGGVCGGLGAHTPPPSWVWRVLFLVLLFVFGTGLVLYIILWICLPEEEPE